MVSFGSYSHAKNLKHLVRPVIQKQNFHQNPSFEQHLSKSNQSGLGAPAPGRKRTAATRAAACCAPAATVPSRVGARGGLGRFIPTVQTARQLARNPRDPAAPRSSPRSLALASPGYKLGVAPTHPPPSEAKQESKAPPPEAAQLRSPARSVVRKRGGCCGEESERERGSKAMGGCFSSSGVAAGDDAGGERRMRVWPSDEDGGRWPYVGERDVDNKAAMFIANFHRHQSGVVCTDCPQTPAAASS